MEEEEENKAEKRWIRRESTEEGTPAPRCEGPPPPTIPRASALPGRALPSEVS